MTDVKKNERLMSLDALRGADMLFMFVKNFRVRLAVAASPLPLPQEHVTQGVIVRW